jgi:hypothetical protein
MARGGISDDFTVLPSGRSVQNAFVEEIVRELIPALDQVAVMASHHFMITLGTLQLSKDLAGRLLGDDSLALAKKSNSKANTLITARSCANFRKGLARAFTKVNMALASAGFPDCQILRCHILLTHFSKEDNTLQPSGEVHRSGIRRKHSAFFTETAGESSESPGTVIIEASPMDSAATNKAIKKYRVMPHDTWLLRKPGDQQPLVTKIKSKLERGWDMARGRDMATFTRKDKLPDAVPDIESKILKYKEERGQYSDSCSNSVCTSDAEDQFADQPLSVSLDLSTLRLRKCSGSGNTARSNSNKQQDEESCSLSKVLENAKYKLKEVKCRSKQREAREREGGIQDTEERRWEGQRKNGEELGKGAAGGAKIKPEEKLLFDSKNDTKDVPTDAPQKKTLLDSNDTATKDAHINAPTEAKERYKRAVNPLDKVKNQLNHDY